MMGVSTDAILAYGYDLGSPMDVDGLPDQEKLYELSYVEGDVQLYTHCSDSYPMFFVAISDTIHVASRGYPKRLDAEVFEKALPWDVVLREFAAKHGLPGPDRNADPPVIPGWHLFSDWS